MWRTRRPFCASCSMFERVLVGGGWERAASHARRRGGGERPWVVLVAGLNGIRKTSAVHEPWFPELLGQAIGFTGPHSALPTGANSFFRQLDYIVRPVSRCFCCCCCCCCECLCVHVRVCLRVFSSCPCAYMHARMHTCTGRLAA